MWATNNNHEALVKVLLDHGASSSQKSSKGRTAFHFVHSDNSKLVDILSHNPRDSISSTSSFGVPGTAGSSSSGSSHLGDNDFYFNSTSEDLDNFMAQEAERHRRLVEAAAELGLDVDLGEFDPNYGDDNGDNTEDGEEYDEDEDKGLNPMNDFLWDKCLPDQMFVFSSDDLNYILDTIITNIKVPVKTRQELCVPANVLFLSARFAHYFSSSELLEEVMKGAMDRMTTCVKSNPRNMSTLAFWITNFTQLLYYLKKDTGLVAATAQYHLRLSELINETYQFLITDAERRIDKILEPAMLEHDQIPGLEEVRFIDDWQRFFKLGNRRSMITPDQATSGANSSVAMKRASSASMMVHSIRQQSLQNTYQEAQPRQVSSFSPRSITTLLSSTLRVLQSYEVHPSIIIQVIAQHFHYISCELFNRILTTKKLLCRSKALQVRMNISYIEDWVRHNNLPASLASYFTPLIQLLQLLQCLSQLSELTLFIDTLKKLDQLNPIQVKRCVVSYRYEVNEPRVPEEIEKYAMQIAEDIVKHKRARNRRSGESQRQSVHTVSSRSSMISLSALQMQRSDSVSSYASSLQQLVTNSLPAMLASQSESAASTPNPRSATPDADFFNDAASVRSFATTGTAATFATSGMIVGDDNEDDDDTTDVVETKDSKFLLPFSVPTTANMLYITGWGPRYDKEGGDSSASGSDDDCEMSKIQREDEERRRKAESERRRREREREAVPIIPDDWMDRLDRTFDRL
ncbi:DIL domain-containing protein [Endogone sp. FLAS-F59071]|nr:DIL domain-containing protein [Endogone sp. FLAS-F59071]|eukprot:RUS13644.1 DIL domain-containing protein [Endogone sp. FLAS-F59071]